MMTTKDQVLYLRKQCKWILQKGIADFLLLTLSSIKTMYLYGISACAERDLKVKESSSFVVQKRYD